MTTQPSCTNQQINSIIVNEQRQDPYFVYYLLSTLQQELKAKAGGAATPIINKSTFAAVPVRVPDLVTQRTSGAILSSYDDLIENNGKRIKLLEEIAQALYREWFVHFRFPGHEQARLIDSSLGPIPSDWSVTRLGELTTKIGSGSTPRGGKESYKNSGVPLFRSMNVYDNQFDIDEAAHLEAELADHEQRYPREW